MNLFGFVLIQLLVCQSTYSLISAAAFDIYGLQRRLY